MDHSDLTGGFTAKLASSKLLMQVLKAIHFKDDATILINGNGLKVTIEDAKSFQVRSKSSCVFIFALCNSSYSTRV